MKGEQMFEVKGSANYAAMIHLYDPANEVALEGRDRVVGYKVLGYQSIVGKGAYEKGEPVIVFGAETQVSEEYAHANNLHRHEHLNADPTQKGYLDDSRRIKAIKFAGHRSDALVMPASSLDYARTSGNKPLDQWEWVLLAGAPFDHVDGQEICRKYVIKVNGDGRSMGTKQGQKKVRVTTESFMEHFDTPNGFRQPDLIRADEHVIVTQKIHGTSVRLAHIPIQRPQTWLDKVFAKFGYGRSVEYGKVVGSRRVTKSINGKSY